jgi:hypothetical protein
VRKDLASAVAAVLGSLPGFTLPFVAALVLSPRDADLLLLAISVAVTQSVIVSTTTELTTVAEFGRLLGRGLDPTPAALRAFRWRVLRFALLLTVVVTPVLAVAYASRSPDRLEFVGLVAAVAATPVLAALGSMLSGECVARGAPVVPIAVQAVRSLVPAVLLLAWPGAPLWLVAAAVPVGEGIRAAVLVIPCRRLRREQARDGHSDGLVPIGLLAQAGSSGVTQLGPAVDRLFLTSSGGGSIASYEMADRLMYAASQFFSLTFLYRRVADWARLPTMEPDAAGRLLRRHTRILLTAVGVLTAAGVAGCLVALASGLLPADWVQGFWWGLIVMLSLPAHAFNVVGTRLLVVARKQHLMVWIAVATAALNTALDAAFYFWLGPVGIVVATVVVRWVMAGVYLVLLRTVVPQTVGQELRAPEPLTQEIAIQEPETQELEVVRPEPPSTPPERRR